MPYNQPQSIILTLRLHKLFFLKKIDYGSKKFVPCKIMENIPVTQETLDQLVQELENLKKVERPHIISEIADARAQGDLKENAEYHAAKDRQGEIESRIHHLEDKIARSVVIAYDPSKSDSIKFGATIKKKMVAILEICRYYTIL